MPIPYVDYAKSCSDLFTDHHQAGSISFTKKGTVGNNGATYELSTNSGITGGKAVEWNLDVDAGNFKLSHDHTGTVSKEFNFDVKQVTGLGLAFKPSFHTATGLNLGTLDLNYNHEKAHLAASLALPVPEAADVKLSLAPFSCCKETYVGFQGTVGASGLSNASWGFHCQKGNLQASFQSNDLTNFLSGKSSIYQFLPDNKNFCCYGIETDCKSSIALAAASACCNKATTRFKLDQAGLFSVAKVQRLNKNMTLNVSAALNAANLTGAGHNFGLGFTFE